MTMTKPKSKHPARKRMDWEAIERDYRTGQFTLRELSTKQGVAHTTISRRAEREGWTKDLAEAVRLATSASLIQATVQQQCTNAHQNATAAVLVAAEVNKQVVLGHRNRLTQLAADADVARLKLVELSDGVQDVREAAVVVGALEALGRLTKTLIDKEREAFYIDAAEPGANGKPKSVASKTIYELTDDELVADIMSRRSQA